MADPLETVHVPDEVRESTATQHVADLPRFGRFQALAEVGAGAMGTVYRAYDDVLGRAVAIKSLHAQTDASVRERFLREAKAIATVAHPNILAIYDAVADHASPYLVMELATSSLRERIAGGPLALDSAREMGSQIARALAAAHAAGIVHRDVKPGNILCVGGTWKLGDFGIARMPDSTLTMSGQFLGSPSYAAPESLRAGAFSPASDVYGLAATLYEALTGAPPHGHELATLMRKLDVDALPIRRSDLPAPLGEAILSALARDPARRPTAEAFARALASTGAIARPSRTLALVAIGSAMVAAIAVIAAMASRSHGDDKREAPAPEATPPVAQRDVTPPDPVPPPSMPAAPIAPSPPQPPAAPSGWPRPSAVLAECKAYESDGATATWSGCPDEIVRRVECKPFMDDLVCDCLEDGTKRWFFHAAKQPDFADADTATRIAIASCKMGFGH